jgi:hypothetical protein
MKSGRINMEYQYEFDFVKELDCDHYAEVAESAKKHFNEIMDKYSVSEEHRQTVAHLARWF